MAALHFDCRSYPYDTCKGNSKKCNQTTICHLFDEKEEKSYFFTYFCNNLYGKYIHITILSSIIHQQF